MGEQGDAALPAELQRQVERIAAALGCDRGERTLEFRLTNGTLAKTFLHHGPIRNEELSRLARTGT
jgi:hypothetical protein